jgi:hypothetical protein
LVCFFAFYLKIHSKERGGRTLASMSLSFSKRDHWYEFSCHLFTCSSGLSFDARLRCDIVDLYFALYGADEPAVLKSNNGRAGEAGVSRCYSPGSPGELHTDDFVRYSF